MLKTHNEKARLEFSAKGKSTKLNDVLKLYSTINYKEGDGDGEKKMNNILFSVLKISFSIYTFLKTLLS